MSTAAWRAAILTLCAIAAIGAVAEFFGASGLGEATSWMGIWGNTLATSSEPFYFRVGSIDPGRASARAGLRQGDLIDIRRSSAIERFGLFGQPFAGRPVTLWVRRGSEETAVAVTPLPIGRSAPFWDTFLTWPGIAWSVFFAGLIAWRRAHVRELRLLSLALVSLAFWFLTDGFSYAAPWLWIYAVVASLNVFGPIAVAIWAACASSLAAPLSPLRRAAARTCYALVAASIALNAARFVGILTLWVDPIALSRPATKLVPLLAVLSALACGMLAIAASPRADRLRSAWLMVPPAVLFIAVYVGQNDQSLTGSYALWLAINFAATAVMFATPVALTYAALSRRLMDVGFVLNRAVVFGIVSTIVVGGFVLVEWVANAWFVNASHTSGAVAAAAIALVLGFSMRYIHECVDRFVDSVFFRKRHEDEAALRQFAHEASYITDRNVLLDRAVQKVRRHTSAEDAAILTLDDDGLYVPVAGNGERAIVSENDPAIIAMHAWHKPIDLHRISDSQLHGELAFPMISRGELLGTLVCEPKRDGEAYAPDESDALLAMAQGIGAALATLSSNGDEPSLRQLLARVLERLPPAP
jgi:GAF domain